MGQTQNGRSGRSKVCDRCQQAAEVLYRAQIDATQRWLFICDTCYPAIHLHNPHYRYGGTWKARKK
jgi:hypothetical protein